MKINKYLGITIITIALGTGLTQSCKKYDEGGTHWRTKSKITDKTWTFDYASDSDTLYKIMDSWETMKFSKNGDWIVNGDKWGTHNFTKDDENKKVKGIIVLVDSNSIYWDSLSILESSVNEVFIQKADNPILESQFNIIQLKGKVLGLEKRSRKNSKKHKTYYNAD